MKKCNRSLFTVFSLLLVVFLSSWGFLVHRTVHQLAVYQLPPSLRSLFYQNMDELVRNSVRPDQRRGNDPTEASRHFIDAEAYGDSSLWKMPQDWQRAVARYTKDTLEKYGYVPYYVLHMKEKLTSAFRKGLRDSVLFYAADMGHYIADAHVPLHTTLNYDGQLTNQKGLHSLWESTLPEINLDQYNLYTPHKATYLSDPEAAIWNTVRTSFTLLGGVLGEEREVSKGFPDTLKYRVQERNGRTSRSYTGNFAKAYGQRLGATVNRQLLSSSEMVADFWYTCWVDAGRPDPALFLKGYSQEQESGLKKEMKAFKKNKLIKEKLLIARKKGERGDD